MYAVSNVNETCIETIGFGCYSYNPGWVWYLCYYMILRWRRLLITNISMFLGYNLLIFLYVTGPAEMDQVGTKYSLSQNGKYLEFCVQYLVSLRCIMLPVKMCIDDKNFTIKALADH